jgi:hypothetical protein
LGSHITLYQRLGEWVLVLAFSTLGAAGIGVVRSRLNYGVV